VVITLPEGVKPYQGETWMLDSPEGVCAPTRCRIGATAGSRSAGSQGRVCQVTKKYGSSWIFEPHLTCVYLPHQGSSWAFLAAVSHDTTVWCVWCHMGLLVLVVVVLMFW
jgi:hypothetical protein